MSNDKIVAAFRKGSESMDEAVAAKMFPAPKAEKAAPKKVKKDDK